MLGGEEDSATLELAAEVGLYFHAHVEVAGGGLESSGRSDALHPDQREDLHTFFEQWRNRHGLALQFQCMHRGLTSASWVDLKGSVEMLAHRAKFADLVCMAVKGGDTHCQDTRALDAMLFSSGRPALLQPMAIDVAKPSILGQPIVIGWNGSAEAVRALTGALPFIHASRRVEVLSIGEKSVNAFDAYELTEYLRWCGIRAIASGIALEDWTGDDVVDAAVEDGAALLVMGARRGGSATHHMLQTLPLAALMAA